MSQGPARRRVGIIGYGHLGQYLVQRLQDEGPQHGLELAFVWNRDPQKLQGKVPASLQLRDLARVSESAVHLLVEVAHPCIARDHGEAFLSGADFMGLKVTMVKHPESFRLAGALGERLRVARAGRAVLYEGPVRDLCPLAPNNVNTMAAACVAAPSLGFDGVRACLVADPSLPDWHVVEVEVTGRPTGERGDQAFTVTSSRRNPASPGAVTGAATFPSFWGSLLACRGHGGQVLLC
ncbi:aspartate dehydrogenase domain-containing protein isoform X4 [Carettochelys insculpta]|uniref:aspartate dehydrogenase domain-containing protein isoform X4 n=1 Tax=Carettochelys insculpta TaxID=44489 RepID=UPI003EBCE62D